MSDPHLNAARSADGCLSLDVLKQLLADQLAKSDLLAVQEHLDRCPRCLAELERLSGQSDVRRLAAEVGAVPSAAPEASEVASLGHKGSKERNSRCPAPRP